MPLTATKRPALTDFLTQMAEPSRDSDPIDFFILKTLYQATTNATQTNARPVRGIDLGVYSMRRRNNRPQVWLRIRTLYPRDTRTISCCDFLARNENSAIIDAIPGMPMTVLDTQTGRLGTL